MRRPTLKANATATEKADFDYELRKLQFRIADLARYRISTVIIDSYADTTEILQTLNKRVHMKDLLVCGSAADYGPIGRDRIESLLRKLGAEIIKRKYRLITGFGRGIGGAVAYGALHEVYSG
ncbi:MAG TPA: hypothetical protein VN678_10690 [Acidobacteriaceae bacterium]|nr:hypothetical protein [Acidobacteriaceae bacterium]